MSSIKPEDIRNGIAYGIKTYFNGNSNKLFDLLEKVMKEELRKFFEENKKEIISQWFIDLGISE